MMYVNLTIQTTYIAKDDSNRLILLPKLMNLFLSKIIDELFVTHFVTTITSMKSKCC
jgi:hypothetical protein